MPHCEPDHWIPIGPKLLSPSEVAEVVGEIRKEVDGLLRLGDAAKIYQLLDRLSPQLDQSRKMDG
jgi:hypothetical protein